MKDIVFRLCLGTFSIGIILLFRLLELRKKQRSLIAAKDLVQNGRATIVQQRDELMDLKNGAGVPESTAIIIDQAIENLSNLLSPEVTKLELLLKKHHRNKMIVFRLTVGNFVISLVLFLFWCFIK